MKFICYHQFEIRMLQESQGMPTILFIALITSIIITIVFVIGFATRGKLITRLRDVIKELKTDKTRLTTLEAGFLVQAHGHHGEPVTIEARRKANQGYGTWQASVKGLGDTPHTDFFRDVEFVVLDGILTMILKSHRSCQSNHTYPHVEAIHLITGWWSNDSK